MSAPDEWLGGVQDMTDEWRAETLEGDPTPLSQASHTAVEAAEVVDLIVKGETYQTGELEVGRKLLEELGDVVVAHLGTLSLLGIDAGRFHEVRSPPVPDRDGIMAQAAEMHRLAARLASEIADSDFETAIGRDIVEVRAMGVLVAHEMVLDRLGVSLRDAVDAALEKNGARDWAGHQEEATR